MDILLINEFFPPDLAPTGQLLEDLARTLAERGHSVTVLCSASTYAADSCADDRAPAQTRVLRVGRRGMARRGLRGTFARYLAFHVDAYRQVRRLRWTPDVTVSLTTPPFVGLTMQWALRGGAAAHVNWVMDLYPHVLVAHGILRSGGLGDRILTGLARRQCRKAALNVVLGGGMAGQIHAMLGQEICPRPTVVPLWAPDSLRPWAENEPNPFRIDHGWRDDETVFLYSGNMGLGHPVAPFLEVARQLHAMSSLRWAFAGAGRRLSEVRAFACAHPEARIECLPYVDRADLRAHLCAADVHLVGLRDTWSDLIVPSKIPAAFAVGKPVILVGSAQSDAARYVCESGGGWVVAESDLDGLAQAIQECRDPDERRRRGAAAHRFARAQFDRTVNCGRMADVVEMAGRSVQSRTQGES